MSYCKDVHEHLGGSLEFHKDEFVCIFCMEDDGLRGFIEREAYAKACTFCGAESTDPIAVPLSEILPYISECLSCEYDAAEEWLPYESAEGGYIGQVLTTRDLLEEHLGGDLPNDDDGILMDALCNGLEEGRIWCEKDYFSLRHDAKLNFSWDAFCELIKHRCRYFFLREALDDQELYSPLALLNELKYWCEQFGLIKTLQAGQTLYRARFQKPRETLKTAVQLGPPPQEKATMANRMSPPGIVMFYFSEEAETALRETAKEGKEGKGRYVIGKFRTLRDVKILDLAEIPLTPSIFEPIPESLEYNPRPPLIFLNYFTDELSRPIVRDQSIHIEYIPTQVITEYFRTEFTYDSEPISGIRYPSARHRGGCSLALFATQDNLVDGKSANATIPLLDNNRWIELAGHQGQDITESDLNQWCSEAPQPCDRV